MASDILGGLLMGFGNFMPQDDPNIKLLNATNELSKLKEQQTKLYADFGRQMLESCDENGPYSETIFQLRQLNTMIAQAEKKLKDITAEKEAKERSDELELQDRTCPQCGEINMPNTKFCQSCGAKLIIHKNTACPKCGAENTSGTKFCGECGERL